MRNIIWTNTEPECTKNIRVFYETEYPDANEHELDEMETMGISQWYDDEKLNLNKVLPEDVVAIANLGFWNGRAMGYKVLGNNLNDCLNINKDCDFATVYCDAHDVRSDQTHHDGTHHIKYRMFKEGLSDEQKKNFLDKICYNTVKSRDITRYTKSLKPYVAEIFGW